MHLMATKQLSHRMSLDQGCFLAKLTQFHKNSKKMTWVKKVLENSKVLEKQYSLNTNIIGNNNCLKIHLKLKIRFKIHKKRRR